MPNASNSSSPSNQPNPDSIPVLLLKTKSTPHDGYEEYFLSPARTYTYEPIFIPVLEHKFDEENLRKVRDLFLSGALKRKYGGLVFTSQRAVEGFSRMIVEEVGQALSSEASRHLALYTVGPATYRSLDTLRTSHLPHATLAGKDAGTGEMLASLILQHYNNNNNNNNDLERNRLAAAKSEEGNGGGSGNRKLPLLFLVGETHRDVIPKTLMSAELPADERIHVDEVVVYRTGVMESFREEFRSTLEKVMGDDDGDDDGDGSRRRPVWVVVFSPTGCDAMVDILGIAAARDGLEDREASCVQVGNNRRRRRDCYIATIGPTTRDHLRLKFGVEPDVCAEKPSPDGVGGAIEMVMGARAEEKE
ncbi:uroporphyrinogen-III synthase [Emydomyces testavorans]|uniref:Uroporphyrinogen-III synthase n=1 Tax=Emydomyces testavorans TaxID=2070801 RepID=A0AAF0DPN5_9EURO|nr:uroporphyrinogen-III synthase [Emydomyces testavorans]